MAQKDVYSNIEPLYSRYARGKYKTLPAGLPPRAFYKIMVACADRRSEDGLITGADIAAAIGSAVGVSINEIHEAAESPLFHCEVPEIHWLTSGRREYRPTDDLLVVLGSLDLEIAMRPVAERTQLMPDRSSIFRLAFPKAARFGFVGAYMLLHQVEGTDQLLVGARLIDNPDPIYRSATPFTLFRFHLDKPIDQQMSAAVVEMCEKGQPPIEARLTGTVLRLGMFAETLATANHRLIVQQKRGALSAALDKRQKGTLPYWPEILSIESPVRQPGGEQSFANNGRAYYEVHSDGERQLMIEWPS